MPCHQPVHDHRIAAGLEAPQHPAEVSPPYACSPRAFRHRELALVGEAQMHQPIAFLLAQRQQILSPGAGPLTCYERIPKEDISTSRNGGPFYCNVTGGKTNLAFAAFAPDFSVLWIGLEALHVSERAVQNPAASLCGVSAFIRKHPIAPNL